MPETPELSEAKRALLEKYLRGEVPRATKAAIQPVQSKPASHADTRVPVVTIQTGGAKRPFFYLHVHYEGGAFYCFPLARDLGKDQPFYVLDPYSFEGLQLPPSLEEMAAAYVKTMRSVQPEGPYLLGGFCGGGLIAFEMARQLHAVDQAVDVLVLIEPKAGPAPLRMLAPHLLGALIRGTGYALKLPSEKQFDWFLRVRHMYQIVRYAKFRNKAGLALLLKPEALRQDWINMFVWMNSHYIPRYYAGKVTYFWARNKPGTHILTWGNVGPAAENDIHIIPGNIVTCRTDHLHDLAEHLRLYLRDKERSGKALS